MNEYNGEKFLDLLYKDLYNSEYVERTKLPQDSREESIKKYMDRLEKIHNMVNTEHDKKRIKELYYKKYVIKKEDISAGLNKEKIIDSQKKSLDKWIDYLTNKNAKYPMWAKYWAFQSMLKMGVYDDIKGMYQKRSKKTTQKFIDADPEIISKCISTVMKKLGSKDITKQELTKIIATDSFAKLYIAFESRKREIFDSTKGIWVKYNYGNKEDAIRLAKSLENKNTKWCTADENMAISQVCGGVEYPGGDFYVYYTIDENGNYTNPRIAIRLAGNDNLSDGEIRGIEEGQNLEEKMMPILEKKLREMSFLNKKDVKENLQKLEDLKELYIIKRKSYNKETLTKGEILNLYTKKYGFGWNNDPNVEKIIQLRNVQDDFEELSNISDKIKFISNTNTSLDVVISNRELLLDAIKVNPYVFQYASPDLKKDVEVILEAGKNDPGILTFYVEEEIKNNRNFIKRLVAENGMALYRVSSEFQLDREIVSIAARQDIFALSAANPELLNDRSFIMSLIKMNSEALLYASEELKNDRDFVMEAIKYDWHALQYASLSLQNDKKLKLMAYKQMLKSSVLRVSKKKQNDDILAFEDIENNDSNTGRIR